jgi:hypothetical protein
MRLYHYCKQINALSLAAISNLVVESIALAVLAHVVTDEQMDLIRLPPRILEFFHNNLRQAVNRRLPGADHWQIAEMLGTLAELAHCDFNKRLMVSQGKFFIGSELISYGVHYAQSIPTYILSLKTTEVAGSYHLPPLPIFVKRDQ